MRFLLLALAACSGAPTTTTTTTTASPTGDPACPVEVSGTSVSVEDTDTGAALVFVTTGDVADVRKRAGAMAQKHNEHHAAMGPLPDGTSNTAGGHDHQHHHHASNNGAGETTGGGMINVHSKATTGEIANGVKLVFVANAADVGKLQTELRAHAQHYTTAGSCESR